jgi:hypothetical protein
MNNLDGKMAWELEASRKTKTLHGIFAVQEEVAVNYALRRFSRVPLPKAPREA